jgi:hypothetical protein
MFPVRAPAAAGTCAKDLRTENGAALLLQMLYRSTDKAVYWKT